jgi:hypothetical protein
MTWKFWRWPLEIRKLNDRLKAVEEQVMPDWGSFYVTWSARKEIPLHERVTLIKEHLDLVFEDRVVAKVRGEKKRK